MVAEIDRDLAPPAEKIGLSLHKPPAARERAAGNGAVSEPGAAPGTTAAPGPGAGRKKPRSAPAAEAGTAGAVTEGAGSAAPAGGPADRRWNGVRITERVSPRETAER
jgi:hypothetical protein